MKFSEMNTMQMADVMCKIAVPLSRIVMDEALNAALVSFRQSEDKPRLSRLSSFIGAVVPIMLDRMYSDTISVIAAMTGKSVDELNAQNGMQTIAEVKDFFDSDFAAFAAAFARGVR